MQLRIFSRTGGKLKSRLPHVTTNFQRFLDWLPLDEFVAHDLETTYTDTLHSRRMLTATYYYGNTVWVLFIEELTEEEMKKLSTVMTQGKFICQGVKFEFKEWKKYGAEIRRMYDTMLAEKLINMGKDFAKADLASILKKYLDIDLDKGLQTSFTSCAEITDEQLRYAVLDVLYLHQVKEQQEEYIKLHDKVLQKSFATRKNRGLKKTNWWNHEFIKVIADLEYKGALLDVDKWKGLYQKALPLVNLASDKLNSIVVRDFKDRAEAEGYLYLADTFHPKLFSSAARKKELLQILYKDIDKTAELELKRYLKLNDPEWPKDLKPTSKKIGKYLLNLSVDKPKYVALKLLLLKRTEDVERLFYTNFRDELIESGLLITAGTVKINWASPIQRKAIFRWIVPKLESTDRPHMEEVAYKHELLSVYLSDYQKVIGMTTKFGLNYLEHIEEDGRLRTNINPIINTGRMSSSKPKKLGHAVVMLYVKHKVNCLEPLQIIGESAA